MTPEKIKEAVENYSNLIIKREKLQKRLIQVSGRDFEQEMIVMQRLESIEKLLEIVDNDEVLTDREACAIDNRIDGLTLREIAEICSLSIERIRQILNKAYKKMAKAAEKQSVA